MWTGGSYGTENNHATILMYNKFKEKTVHSDSHEHLEHC